MLRLRDISKTFVVDEEDIRFFEALKSVNITLTKNEFVVILGKSGSGKSTLLNIISGIDTFDNGTYYYFENRVNKFEEAHFDYFRSKKLGMVFQNYYLIDHLSVIDNVIIAQKFGQNKTASRQDALNALKEVGLSGYELKKPHQLSSGERQRVSIARSIVNHPKIILADEPTGNLDSNTSKEILDLFKKLSKDRLIVMVTHDEDAAVVYADRVIQIDDGRVVLDYKVTDKGSELVDEEVIFKKRSNKSASIFYGLKNIYIYKTRLIAMILMLSLAFSLLVGIVFYQNGYNSNIIRLKESLTERNDVLIGTQSDSLIALDFNEIKNEIINSVSSDTTIYYYHELNIPILEFMGQTVSSRNYLEDVLVFPNQGELDDIKVYDDGRIPQNEGEILLSYQDAIKIVQASSIEQAWVRLKDIEISVPYEIYYQFNYGLLVQELNRPTPRCTLYQWNQEDDSNTFNEVSYGNFNEYKTSIYSLFGTSGLPYQGNQYFSCNESFLIESSSLNMLNYFTSDNLKSTRELKVVGIINNIYINRSYIHYDSAVDMINKNHKVSKDYIHIYLPPNNDINLNGYDISYLEYINDILIQMDENNQNVQSSFVFSVLFGLFGIAAIIAFINQVVIQTQQERKSMAIIRSVGGSKTDIRTIYLTQGSIIGIIMITIIHLFTGMIVVLGNVWNNTIARPALESIFIEPPFNLFGYNYWAVLISSIVALAITIVIYYTGYKIITKEKIVSLIRNK